MKAWPVCVLLASAAALAQPNGILTRLTGEITALKSLPAVAEDTALSGLPSLTGGDPLNFRMNVADRSPERYRASNWIAGDIGRLHSPFPGDFRNWEFAYALTGVLAGKELSDERVAPLTEAIAGVVESAVYCRSNLRRLVDSTQFRDSMVQGYQALVALDVTAENARVVMSLLYRAGEHVAHRGSKDVPMYPNYR